MAVGVGTTQPRRNCSPTSKRNSPSWAQQAGPSPSVATRWGWAFSLRSLGAHFGYLAVSADAEPTTGEQFLLRVLAQQAGVALANARLHTRQRGQAAELLATNNRLAGTLSALERSLAIHDSLTRVAVAGEGQEGIAQAVHELTGFAVAVEDRHGNLRAWAGPNRPDPYVKESPDHREEVVSRAHPSRGADPPRRSPAGRGTPS